MNSRRASSPRTASRGGWQRATGPAGVDGERSVQRSTSVRLPDVLTVRQLSDAIDVSPIEVIKSLMKRGVMAAMNQAIPHDLAVAVAEEFGFTVETAGAAAPITTTAVATAPATAKDEDVTLEPRPPVVTILGHVDHGKTTLLDYIRNTRVAAGEVGGITQHIGAYQVEVKGQKITFIDTPGHEAFTSMRARGAQVTDIAILIVAADDGVMPQTVEAINHAQAAGVPIVVAINKIDLPQANPDRVKQQLSEHGLIIEEWGGDVICVNISARTGEGVDDLLENVLVLAEIMELKADPNRPATGVIIESSLDTSRGPMATVLVKQGTLRVGDAVVAGDVAGKIKAMFDHLGRRIVSAGPSTPVEIMGLDSVPAAGETLIVLEDERAARLIGEERKRQAESRTEVRAPTLESLSSEITAGRIKELNIILKADVHGSVEAIRSALERLSGTEVKVRIVHAAAGNISESDVMLALATKGIIIGFNSRPDPSARRLADAEKVDIRQYNIIYELLDDVEKALKGLLEPIVEEVVEGHAEVRQVFRVSRLGNVAGCYVRDGQVTRNSFVRVMRGNETLYTGRIASLKRFKDDVREVTAGYECGIGIDGFDDVQVGDTLEFYRQERRSR